MRFHFMQLLKYLPIFVVNRHVHGKMLVSKSFKCSLNRTAISEIPAHSQFNMRIGYPNIVGRINASPAILRNPGLDPGMCGTLTAQTSFIRAYITAYVTAWYF